MRPLSLVAILVSVVSLRGAASADINDLVLSRLGTCTMGGVPQLSCAGADDVVPNNQEFRSLASELGVVIAPKFLSPSDTLGYSGFQYSAEFAGTQINNSSSYWCATEQSGNCDAGTTKGDGWMGTFGVFARKGIWMPLPSFELGGGAVHIFKTRSMWAAQAYAKFAIHEGFHDWPLPSVAARGAVARLMGSEQIDLTVASLDVSISKSFGLQGTVNLSPYGGWNYLWIIPRSEVLDKTPNVDARDPMNAGDINMNFVFPDQDNITRQRFFFGLKMKYYVFALTVEANIALAGTSVDDRGGTDQRCDEPGAPQNRCDAEDKAGGQQTYSASISLDF